MIGRGVLQQCGLHRARPHAPGALPSQHHLHAQRAGVRGHPGGCAGRHAAVRRSLGGAGGGAQRDPPAAGCAVLAARAMPVPLRQTSASPSRAPRGSATTAWSEQVWWRWRGAAVVTWRRPRGREVCAWASARVWVRMACWLRTLAPCARAGHCGALISRMRAARWAAHVLTGVPPLHCGTCARARLLGALHACR
jgi:hypothetical protein